MKTPEKIKATCYGVWGIPYYRTETGHTFSIDDTPRGHKMVFYYGNVKESAPKLRILTEEEMSELFDRVEFVY